MSDITAVTTQSSSTPGDSALTGLETALGNLNTDKQEKGSGVTGNIVKFGASNVLGDTGKVAPSGTIVGDTDSQTLTNKTLTSPTITTPTIASFTNATHNHTNGAGGGQLTDSALSAAVTVPKGGTGVATLAAHGLLIGNGASAVVVSGAGTSGQILTSNGASSDPTFQAAPSTAFFQRFAGDGFTRSAVGSVPGGISSASPVYVTGNSDAASPILSAMVVDALTGAIGGLNTQVTIGASAFIIGAGRTWHVTALGSYVYACGYDNNNTVFKCYRLDAGTLLNQALMTVSGTAPSNTAVDHPIFTDGTYLYISDGATIGNLKQYSISGTTLTFVATIAFTSFAAAAAFCDGTNVFQSDGTTFRKWALAGGAVSSSRTTLQGGTSGFLPVAVNSGIVLSYVKETVSIVTTLPVSKL